MRSRERERFMKMGFSGEELEIRDKLYKAKKNATYKIIITEERVRNGKYVNKFGDDVNLMYFADNPEEGDYVDTVYFSRPKEFNDILRLYEGLFYRMFDMESGEMIGYGSLDPDSPIEEIRMHTSECGSVCEYCFWRGMLYGEEKEMNGLVTCYHPTENEAWKRIYESYGKAVV